MSTLCYIDPASTALIWQVLAGIFISLGVVFGVFWRKITTNGKSGERCTLTGCGKRGTNETPDSVRCVRMSC